ncbi:MAG: hypothetical protein RLZZ292_3478 [Bacteroidota bacterium]
MSIKPPYTRKIIPAVSIKSNFIFYIKNMIVSIKIQHFLSFGDGTITLRPDSNLLAGINGSGKSNFLQAVRLLKAAVSERNGLQSTKYQSFRCF